VSDLTMTLPDVDELLVDSAVRLFTDTCSFDAVQAAEDTGWAPEIWQAVADAGFAWIGLPDTSGGSGGTVADACEVLRIAGAFAAPIPLAETAMLGGWLLTEAGIALPDGAVTVAPGMAEDAVTITAAGDGSCTVSGTVHRVPWAADADRIALLVADEGSTATVVAVDPSSAGVTIEAATNLAGEPRPRVAFDGVSVAADQTGDVATATGDELRLRGALTRTVLSAGALEAMSRLTVDYTEQRQQFGRPVGRFQAVQQHLVWGAQDAAITKMAAQVAARTATTDGVKGARFQIAAARSIADGCAATATRWAHQAHGAMGMTQEYALHHLSRRLWAWRHEWTSPGEWSVAVGRLAEQAGADGLYPLITS
jgi:acyl-CoA dehydrogenase